MVIRLKRFRRDSYRKATLAALNGGSGFPDEQARRRQLASRAIAGEVRKDKAPITTVKSKALNDVELDKITAGFTPGLGIQTANERTENVLHNFDGNFIAVGNTGRFVGTGTCNAGITC